MSLNQNRFVIMFVLFKLGISQNNAHVFAEYGNTQLPLVFVASYPVLIHAKFFCELLVFGIQRLAINVNGFI